MTGGSEKTNQPRSGFLQWVAHQVARRRFSDETVASHHLGFASPFAGCIDDCEDGRLRGWVYDARHPDHVLTLSVHVDGKPIQKVIANKYRDDLAFMLRDNGIHGFETVVPELKRPVPFERKVTLSVVGHEKYSLGPLSIAAEISESEFVFMQNLTHKLQHIFDHVTATHERGLERFDRVQDLLEQVRITMERGRSSPGSTLRERTAIAGVGQFRAPLPDAIEEALMENAIEDAIRRQSGSPH